MMKKVELFYNNLSYLSLTNIKQIFSYLKFKKKYKIDSILEKKFSNLICNKNLKYFFSTARMGLYFFFKNLPKNKKNEIIITAFTCSVIVNALKIEL